MPALLRSLGASALVIGILWLTVAPGTAGERWVQAGLATVAALAVGLRHHWPLLATAAALGATATATALGLTGDPFLLAALCVFTLAESRGSRSHPWWLISGVAVLALCLLGLSSEGVELRLRSLAVSTVVLAASWVFGVRIRRARDAAAGQARDEERLRLARDVHDVLSHSLGSIGVRAGVSAHVRTLSVQQLRVTLDEIAGEARTSLAELGTLLARERDNAPPVSLSLSAALSQIGATATSAGFRVNVDITPTADALGAGLQTTVYRVVQEATTNAIRHSGGTELSVVISAGPGGLTVTVSDNGRGLHPRSVEGHGLTGMRERVSLLGGSMSLDSTPGLRVTVVLPTGPDA